MHTKAQIKLLSYLNFHTSYSDFTEYYGLNTITWWLRSCFQWIDYMKLIWLWLSFGFVDDSNIDCSTDVLMEVMLIVVQMNWQKLVDCRRVLIEVMLIADMLIEVMLIADMLIAGYVDSRNENWMLMVVL